VIVTATVEPGQLAELVKQVQAGHDVVLLQGDQPVARLVPAVPVSTAMAPTFRIRSLKGHRVLTPTISQGDLANELFDRP
jgi:antitoxin (DNA-binding transcriptional repressor) of toxin-antitoxin stability system